MTHPLPPVVDDGRQPLSEGVPPQAGSGHSRAEPEEVSALRASVPNAVELAIAAVREELVRAISKFPTWPTDPLHAVAVVGEEAGELTKATLQAVYEPGKNRPNAVRDEAMQAAAMAIRFLASISEYKFEEGAQHVVR